MDSREMTFGEKAVGLTFNPSGDQTVHELKEAYAKVIDVLYNMRQSTHSTEQARLASIAITEAQGAQMWAVKAATWRD